MESFCVAVSNARLEAEVATVIATSALYHIVYDYNTTFDTSDELSVLSKV